MADVADIAGDLEERHRQYALGLATSKPYSPQISNASGQIICTACGAPISQMRLDALPNASRCTACQQAWEVRRGY